MPALTMQDDPTIKDTAKFCLARSGVKVKKDGTMGGFTFIVPASLEAKLRKEYNFSASQLSVGGDIPLSELAVHLDEQASLEYHIGTITEFTRYQLEQKRNEYDMWHEKMYFKCREHLVAKKIGSKDPTEKLVNAYITTRHGNKVKKFKNAITTLEMQYRMLNNVIRASLITKGTLLPSLRNIIQGRGDSVELTSKESNKVRNKLKVK